MAFPWHGTDAPVPAEVDVEPETIKAKTLLLMAQHAAIEPRGFDTIRARAEIARQIDDLLDDWLLLTAGA